MIDPGPAPWPLSPQRLAGGGHHSSLLAPGPLAPTIVPPEAQKAVLGCSWVQVSTQEGVGEGKGRGFERGGLSWNAWRRMLAHLTEAGGKI